MTTIGDSFSVVALLLATGFTMWALILTSSLLFSERVNRAKIKYEQRPWLGFGIGVIALLTLGLGSLVISQAANPLAKIIGLGGMMFLLLVSSFGSAGLCQLVAQRIQSLEPSLSPYAALNRSAMLIVVSVFFPAVGWFFIGPVLLITSLGIGLQAMLARTQVVAEVN